MNEITGPHTWASQHPDTYKKLIVWSLIFFAFLAGLTILWPEKSETAPEASSTTRDTNQAPSPKSAQPDPCGLKDVVCPAEKNVILATVYTYQAVPEQTDADSCHTASGLNVCAQGSMTDFYGIIANNCLPFHTVVEIRDNHYLVEDRMNARYGCSVFDILTDGENFKLTNEPVTVL
jgi:hypothetical protein